MLAGDNVEEGEALDDAMYTLACCTEHIAN